MGVHANAIIGAIGSLLLASASATAQVAHNTGAPGNVNAAFQDAQWQVSTDFGATYLQAYQVQNPPFQWQPATPAYSWIAATVSATGGGGDYIFRTFIDLSGYDPSTAALSFRCAVDDGPLFGGGFISLNGGAYAGSCTFHQFGSTQTLTSGFVNGLNEVRFAVSGNNLTDGLLVGDMNIRASAVSTIPEPASVLLLATGLVGVFATVHRRRRVA